MTMIDGLVGITVGTATTVGMLAAASLDGSTISIESAVGVIIFIASICWWMSGKFQKQDDNHAAIVARLSNIERALKNCPKHKESQCETAD